MHKYNNRRILIINDITGYGRVSTFAMFPIITAYGFHPYVLPTAIVSNTMDYGSSEILDTSEFMRKTVKKWNDFGFSFDTLCTGFINSIKQIDIIIEIIESQQSPFLVLDPIMADNGELYPGMYEGVIEANKKLASYADIMIPNLTEAELLTGLFIGEEALSDINYTRLLNSLYNLGPKNIVITGCKASDGRYFNLVSSGIDNLEKIYFELINDSFVGTGDVFSATLISEILSGNSLIDSVKAASDFVKAVILENTSNNDHFDIRLEASIHSILNKQY